MHTAGPDAGPATASSDAAAVAVCFSCGNPIEGETIPLNATQFRAAPGYGSDYDGTGELEICVCDTCLTERRDRVSRLVITRSTRARREAWRP